jgi:hypothetical protein
MRLIASDAPSGLLYQDLRISFWMGKIGEATGKWAKRQNRRAFSHVIAAV